MCIRERSRDRNRRFTQFIDSPHNEIKMIKFEYFSKIFNSLIKNLVVIFHTCSNRDW